MIINYLPTSNYSVPNPSQIVADLAAQQGISVTTNLQGQTENADVIIWQYDQQTSTSQYLAIEQESEDTKLVLWINDFASFVKDKYAKQYLNMADFVVVPTNNARDKVVEVGLDINKIQSLEIFDCPIDWSLEANVPYSRDVHEVKFSEGKEVWQNQVKALNNIGGFALVQNDDPYNVPLELSVAVEAGVPVIAKAGTISADLVINHNLGFVYRENEAPQNLAAEINESQYLEWSHNAQNMAADLKDGHHLASVIRDVMFYSRIDHNLFDSYTSIYTKSTYDIRVMDTADTLDFIHRRHD